MHNIYPCLDCCLQYYIDILNLLDPFHRDPLDSVPGGQARTDKVVSRAAKFLLQPH